MTAAAPAGAAGLAEAAVALGEPMPSAANLPVALDDPASCWFVEDGALDVFLVEYSDGAAASNARHMLRAAAGRLVFGMTGSDTSLAATAKGLPGTSLRRVRLADLLSREDLAAELSSQADAWVSEFAAAVAAQIEPRSRPDLLVDVADPDSPIAAGTGSVVSARSGGVAWVAPADPAAAYLGTGARQDGGTGLIPLTSDTWLSLGGPETLQGVPTAQLCADGRLPAALSEFHRLALEAEQLNRLLLVADEINERTTRTAHRRLDHRRARLSLFNVMGRRRVRHDDGSALMAALQLIGKREGVVFSPPRRGQEAPGEEPELADVLAASSVRGRKIRLAPEERWWLGDSGAMLAYRKDSAQPVALLPRPLGRYRAVDPATGQSLRINAARAHDIDRTAWTFYRPLPDDRPVTTRDLAGTAGKGGAADMARFLAAGLLAGALTLAPAVMVGMLADWVLPTAAGGMVAQISLALASLALAGLLLHLLGGTAMMRLESRFAVRLGAAAWDRLLKLPSSFFRGFTAGELAVRVTVFQTLRNQLSGVVTMALTSTVFLLPTLGVLFAYDAPLAWVTIAVGALVLAVAAAVGVLQIHPHRRRFAAARRLSGELFQFINGMSKLRSAGAEPSAFASWARGYREQHLAGIAIGRLNEPLTALGAALPPLGGAALFGAAAVRGDGVELGGFLVVFAVTLTFYGAVTTLGFTFEALAAVVPTYEQAKPILAAVPDSPVEGAAAPELVGEIRFDHVSFRYRDDGPLIIDDVSIRAQPGEFIAIVGESGAGKSTLVQLALGLETPESGGVYYDGRDLANLDSRSVRRQIGVVMQDGAFLPGNILENIIGLSGDLTIDDAWHAARLAAVDEDLEAMPMGIFTPVSSSSATFSGGQIQRIRIAAALVRRPPIVFLDEATSWLDARSQAEVMRGVESLAATRIVIAHRLSTIRRAERIYVLEAGRVCQSGTFDELVEAEGTFRTLVMRQMA